MGHLSCSDATDSRLKVTLGTQAAPNQYPAVALLKKDSSNAYYVYCSGVLLDTQHVLTAAHCSVDFDFNIHNASEVRVSVGEIYPSRPDSNVASVSAIRIHPKFSKQGMMKDARGLVVPGEAHDIAVWKLADPIESFQSQVLRLASPEDLQAGTTPTLVGYGLRDPWATGSEPILTQARSLFKDTFNVSVNQKVLVNGRWITKKVDYVIDSKTSQEFFLGGPGMPDTCGGDSGGPVFVEDEQGLLLVGLTSRGISTCDKGGIYTFVPTYKDWIDSTLATF